MSNAQVVRIADAFIAADAEQVEFDKGRQVAQPGRRARLDVEARLPRVQLHLVAFVRPRGGTDGYTAGLVLLVGRASHARTSVAEDGVQLDVTAKRDGRVRTRQLERALGCTTCHDIGASSGGLHRG